MSKRFSIILNVLALLFLIISMFALKDLVTQRDAYSPLGEYSTQTVITTSLVNARPVVYSDEEIVREAIKCNETNQPVPVGGSRVWSTVDPLGTVIVETTGTGVREPGCQKLTYRSRIPQTVIDRTKELNTQGFTNVVWRISGVETPTDHADAVGRSWSSENFIIIVR